jgi:hypothetical protein
MENQNENNLKTFNLIKESLENEDFDEFNRLIQNINSEI